MNTDWADADTIIIGAGAAGLAAAHELCVNQHRCTILEARDRLGGRIYTRRTTAADIPIELGAEFIHGQSPVLFDWLRESRSLAVDAARERWSLHRGRLRRTEHQLDELKRRFRRLPDPDPDITFADFLHRHRRALPQPVREIACAMVEGFDAADTRRISAREVREEWSGPAAADGPAFRPSHGYDVLVHAMRAGLTDRASICLETVVHSIDWRKGRVEIAAERHGEPVRIKAKRAVVTIPLGVLQMAGTAPGSVRFSPELAGKLEAFEQLATGPVIKVVLTFSRPFWTEMKSCRYRDAAFFFAPRAAFPTFWTSLPARTATLVAWSAGPGAQRLQGLGENEILGKVFASLRTLFGQHHYSSLLEGFAWHDWQSDPYARGAYSYVLARGSAARQTLATPSDGTLFFAGEACDTQGEAATVGGALRSGATAARQVLDSAGKSGRWATHRARAAR